MGWSRARCSASSSSVGLVLIVVAIFGHRTRYPAEVLASAVATTLVLCGTSFTWPMFDFRTATDAMALAWLVVLDRANVKELRLLVSDHGTHRGAHHTLADRRHLGEGIAPKGRPTSRYSKSGPVKGPQPRQLGFFCDNGGYRVSARPLHAPGGLIGSVLQHVWTHRIHPILPAILCSHPSRMSRTQVVGSPSTRHSGTTRKRRSQPIADSTDRISDPGSKAWEPGESWTPGAALG